MSKEKIRRGSPESKYYGQEKFRRRAGGAIKSFAYSQYETKKLGKMGAASPVRRIDPATVDLSKYLPVVEKKVAK